jgi:dTDP-4-dehydrorhamnose reductase
MSPRFQEVKLKTILVMGSKGMLGIAFMRSSGHNFNIIPVSREDFDFTSRDELYRFLDAKKPEVVINVAANINLAECERNKVESGKINVDFVGNLSNWCSQKDSFLVQISTDHFYNYGSNKGHYENDEVVLLNEYAKQKYAAEKAAENSNNSLVIRTSILGYRNSGALTFIEWVLSTIKARGKITGFVDAYTSSIDVDSFVGVVFLSIKRRLTGVYNIACSEVYSKYDLIEAIISNLDIPDIQLEPASVSELVPKRANCCGLDVIKVQQELGISLPNLAKVVQNLNIQEKYNEL